MELNELRPPARGEWVEHTDERRTLLIYGGPITEPSETLFRRGWEGFELLSTERALVDAEDLRETADAIRLVPNLPVDRAVICVTGDHATPTYPDVIHSGDPVPLVVAGPGVRPDDVISFGELDCSRGILGHLRGPDLMPVLLNAADRPLFLGSRPTPFAAADGYPAVLEPLKR